MLPPNKKPNSVEPKPPRNANNVIGEHITLDFQFAADPDTIRADRGQIEQILMNLCVNARDAMEDRGTLIIETQNISFSDEFCKTNPQTINYLFNRIGLL